MKRILFLMLLLLAGCTSTEKIYEIDNERYSSIGKNERIQFIVLHYTATTNDVSIRALTQGEVSSHYLILEGDDDKIYNLVPDNERAWHAGVSEFRGRNNINDTSIGIEIVNEGIATEFRSYPTYYLYDHYVDYDKKQIEKVGQLLLKLKNKYSIADRNIIAHSDIAPSRKTDPGAKFPWKLLYDKYGVGAWYDEVDKEFFMLNTDMSTISIQEIKDELRLYGYKINNTDIWDKESKDVIYAFQLHFNPKNLTAEMDLETFAILKALNKKYVK